jgi:hypothetical protein
VGPLGQHEARVLEPVSFPGFSLQSRKVWMAWGGGVYTPGLTLGDFLVSLSPFPLLLALHCRPYPMRSQWP